MKSIKLSFFALAMISLMMNCSKSDNPPPPPPSKLIAHYPLVSDAVDLTGLNSPMSLINTPFQNGGIYCNGQYIISSSPSACNAQTPSIFTLDYGSFSVSMDFFVTEIRRKPVWVLGNSCRWLGFYLLDDGTISLLYNNANFFNTNKSYSINEWHNSKITFDGSVVEIFLDNVSAGSLKFGGGYVPLDYTTCGINDNDIGVTNYSNGEVFMGFVKELKVYSPK